MTQFFVPYLRTTYAPKPSCREQVGPYLRPWFFTLEFVFFIFIELFHRHARREN